MLLKFDQGELVIGLPVGEDKGPVPTGWVERFSSFSGGINDGAKLGKEGEKGRIKDGAG